MQGVRCQNDGVPGARGESTETGIEIVDGDPGRIEQSGTVDHLGQTCGCGPDGGTAFGFGRDSIDPTLRRGFERHADEIATGRATGGAGEGPVVRLAPVRGVPEIVLDRVFESEIH